MRLKGRRERADAVRVRLAGVTTAAVLALVAGAVALIPLGLQAHRSAARPPAFSGTTTVWAVPVDGGPPRELLRLSGRYSSPTGLPDGSLVLVRPTTAGAGLWRFRDGHGTRIAALPELAAPVWSPNRSRYALWEPNAQVVIRRLDGTRVRTLTRQPGIGGIGCSSWAGPYIACVRESRPHGGWRLDVEVWRPDGTLVRRRRLAFPFGSTTAVVAPGGRVLVVRPFRGGREAPAPAPTPLFTPDGRTLVFVDRRGRLVARGVRTRVLMQRALGDFGLSADGATVYVARVKAAVSIPK